MYSLRTDGLCVRIETHSRPAFPGVLESTIHQLTSSFWWIDTQAGPFRITDKSIFSELDAEIERYRVSVPELEDASSALWRPEIFPRFEELLCLDEWTYLVSLQGPEADAVDAAKEFSKTEYLSPRFFELVQSKAATFFLFVANFWEVYSVDRRLLDEIRTQKNVSPIQSGKWLQGQKKG